MIFKISAKQIRNLLLTSILLLSLWVLMGHYAGFKLNDRLPEGQMGIDISFLAPMNHQQTIQHLRISCLDFPEKKVSYQTKWVSRNTVQIIIHEVKYPKGLQYQIAFKKAPALIPPFTVSAQKKVRMPLTPRLQALEPGKYAATNGPLLLVFNTPLQTESFKKYVTCNANGSFSPLIRSFEKDKPQYDFSRWIFKPSHKLNNNSRYRILVKQGLTGLGGGQTKHDQILSFDTAPALIIAEIYPRPYDPSVWLNRQITVQTNQPLKEAKITVEGMDGELVLTENGAVFKPQELFLPSRTYHISAQLTSVYGEKTSKDFWYGTTDLGNKKWIDLKLGNPCRVQVYAGNKPLACYQAWLTMAEKRVPKVTMYEELRGSTLEKNPKDHNPVQYLRLNADIMLHCLRDGEKHNHNAMGLPPSFGCLLLNQKDMDWIINNIPAKCMVIVH